MTKKRGRPKGIYTKLIPDEQRLRRFTIRLPLDVINWLRDRPESSGRLIENALKTVYRIGGKK